MAHSVSPTEDEERDVDPQRWQRLESLFEQATDLPASRRESFLAGQCHGDAALADELRSLLRAHDTQGGPLDTPPAATAPPSSRPARGSACGGSASSSAAAAPARSTKRAAPTAASSSGSPSSC